MRARQLALLNEGHFLYIQYYLLFLCLCSCSPLLSLPLYMFKVYELINMQPPYLILHELFTITPLLLLEVILPPSYFQKHRFIEYLLYAKKQ